MSTVLVLILGLVAGIFSALLGVGGGIILIPGMVFLLGMELHKAIGTSLAIIIPTALMGVYRHNLHGNIEWTSVLLIVVGSVVGAYIGAWGSNFLSPDTLRKIFVVFLLLTAFKMWRG